MRRNSSVTQVGETLPPALSDAEQRALVVIAAVASLEGHAQIRAYLGRATVAESRKSVTVQASVVRRLVKRGLASIYVVTLQSGRRPTLYRYACLTRDGEAKAAMFAAAVDVQIRALAVEVKP